MVNHEKKPFVERVTGCDFVEHIYGILALVHMKSEK